MFMWTWNAVSVLFIAWDYILAPLAKMPSLKMPSTTWLICIPKMPGVISAYFMITS